MILCVSDFFTSAGERKAHMGHAGIEGIIESVKGQLKRCCLSLKTGNRPWFWVMVLVLCAGCASERLRTENALAPGEHRVELNGLELWYMVSGRGPVCVFPTAGWGPSSDIYIASMKPLEEQFTIVYLDTRGTGRSEQPGTPEEYTWKHFADDLDALRDHLGMKKIRLIGHSMGGVMVLHYALEYPRRVEGLVVLDSLAAEDEFHSQEMDIRWQALKEHPPFRPIVEELSKVDISQETEAEFIENTRKLMPLFFSTMDAYEKAYAAFKTGFDSTTLSYHADRGMMTSAANFTLVERLGQIQCPTLLVVGTNDFICSPKEAQRLHLGLPNSKLIVIEKAGHFPWIEQPDEFFFWVRKYLPAMGYRGKIQEL
jgi:proline iminopeptidase